MGGMNLCIERGGERPTPFSGNRFKSKGIELQRMFIAKCFIN